MCVYVCVCAFGYWDFSWLHSTPFHHIPNEYIIKTMTMDSPRRASVEREEQYVSLSPSRDSEDDDAARMMSRYELSKKSAVVSQVVVMLKFAQGRQ